MDHILDRPVWAALTTSQKSLGIGDERALRYRPEINLFAAAADRSTETLSVLGDLARLGDALALVESQEWTNIPGTRVERIAQVDQMLWEAGGRRAEPIDHLRLGEPDAPEMLALATLTKPGPFSIATHRMGEFIGVRVDGRLAAMAGQRFRVPGYVEVSAVCTHPDHRGQGYAARLMQVLIDRIVAAGEMPFLHTYPDNAAAIRLYESLGFRRRTTLTVSFLASLDPAPAPSGDRASPAPRGG